MAAVSTLSARPDEIRRRAARAFTLIELLVVIAIIAVLVALLTPAAERALSTARRVACAANMHQYGVAVHAYASDAGGIMPPIWQRGWYDPPVRGLAGRGRGRRQGVD